MEHAPIPAKSKLLMGLCWLQTCGVIAAAGASFVKVESIIASCPAITFFGLLLAHIATQRASVRLFLFGLAAPMVAGTLAMLIWFFSWLPVQAKEPVQTSLTLNAGVIVGWGIVSGVLTSWPPALRSTAIPVRLQFSIRALLIVITLSSFVFAISRFIELDEMAIFCAYGIVVLLLCMAIAVRFASRMQSVPS